MMPLRMMVQGLAFEAVAATALVAVKGAPPSLGAHLDRRHVVDIQVTYAIDS